MKRPYTQYRSALRRFAKAHGMNEYDFLKDLDWEKSIENVSAHYCSSDPHYKERVEMAFRIQLNMECLFHLGDAINLFVTGDKKFCDWLVGCVKDSFDTQCFRVMQDMVGDKVIAVHFPTSNGIPSLMFGVLKSTSMKRRVLYASGSVESRWSFLKEMKPEGEDILDINDIEEIGSRKEVHHQSDYHMKLLVGICLYKEAFPEAIVEGLPEDLKHPAHHKFKETETIGVSPKIAPQTSHASPVAHYREGHFRTLKSEHYTKKRFQVIFIHGTFVKGQAKTLLSV